MAEAIRSGAVGDPFDIRYNNYQGLREAIRSGRVHPVRHERLLAHLPAVVPDLARFGPPVHATALADAPSPGSGG
jgi:hypothetical protein